MSTEVIQVGVIMPEVVIHKDVVIMQFTLPEVVIHQDVVIMQFTLKEDVCSRGRHSPWYLQFKEFKEGVVGDYCGYINYHF